PFNRWQALQTISMRLLIDNVAALRARKAPRVDEELMVALAALLENPGLEPAFVALALTLPGEADIAREIGRYRSRSDPSRQDGLACGDRRAARPCPLDALLAHGGDGRLFARCGQRGAAFLAQ